MMGPLSPVAKSPSAGKAQSAKAQNAKLPSINTTWYKGLHDEDVGGKLHPGLLVLRLDPDPTLRTILPVSFLCASQ